MSNEIRAKDIKELLEETIEDVTNTAKGIVEVEGTELSTGLLNLDGALGGLWPGELVCIAGTSRSGRHALACQIAFAAAKQGASVLLVSTEMSENQVALRALSAEARVDFCRLQSGELGEDDWKRVVDAAGAVSGYDLHVCCSRDVGMGDVVELAGQVLEGCDKGLIVVCGMRRIAEGCGRDAGWAAAQLKDFAVKMGVCAVATVDVAEGIARCIRKGGYDPGDVGVVAEAVEDECDALMFLDRSVTPEEGARADAPDFGTAVVAVARSAHGSCGLVRFAYAPEFGRFLDLVDDEDIWA